MRYIIILLLVWATSCYAQKDTVVDKGIYKVLFSQKLKQPLMVEYIVKPTVSVADRKGLDFHLEKGIITTTSKDYKSNLYDKGHMAPAETFSNSEENMYKTFSYVNCTMQHFKLNRGVWKILEAKEREWSKIQAIKVTIIVVYDLKSTPSSIVPKGFFKFITFIKSKETLIFYFPNIECTNNISDYKMAKSKKVQADSLLQENGRGFVSGVWLTPQQAFGLAHMMKETIDQYEQTLPAKLNPTQANYIKQLKDRLAAAELIAGLR